MIYLSHYHSPLGAITLAGNDSALLGLWFDGQKYDRAAIRGMDFCERETQAICCAKTWLSAYFSGQRPNELPPLQLAGSDFRKCVCKIMLTIPYGHTMTYGEIAAEAAHLLGRARMSAQAVGGAVGHNPISLIIPCHRVVGSSGSLTGYAGGIERKLWLLGHEGIDIEKSGFFIPQNGNAL